MRFGSIVLTVGIALVLQMVVARFTIGGHWIFDLVLIAVVLSGFEWGPPAGILAGTIGGLAEDLLSGGVVGVGGLAKTLVGFAAGAIGTQFVLTTAPGRTLILAGASVVNRLLMLALYGVIDQQWPRVSWTGMLTETAINSLCGWLVFHGLNTLPGTLERRRSGGRLGSSRARRRP
jgi:rod shape-determining protein MreD